MSKYSEVHLALIDEGSLVIDTRGFYHRPAPKCIGRTEGNIIEYDLHLKKCREGWCPICDTKFGHAPKCVLGIAIENP